MAGIEGAGNLKRNGINPLKPTAKARDQQAETVRFDVDLLKNGGRMDLNGMAAGNSGPEQNSGENSGPQNHVAEERLTRLWKRAPKARESHKSNMPVEEQAEQLGKIRKSAMDYEAVLLDQLVKQMRQSPLTKTPGGDTFNDIAEQPFRDFLSQAGGMGLADSITLQVARQQGLEQTLHDYPEIMGPGWRPTIPPNMMKKSPGGLEMASESSAGQAVEPSARRSEPEKPTELEPAAEPGETVEAEKKAGAGLMSSEEIAWLYNDAVDGLA